MAFDFTLDPGTAEDLQKEIDAVTFRYTEQGRQIQRAEEQAQRFQRQLERIQQTYRRRVVDGMNPRQFIGNARDIVDLGRGEFSARNFGGALELIGESLGGTRLGGFIAGASRFAGIAGVVAAPIFAGISKINQDAETAERIGRTHKKQVETFSRALGTDKKVAEQILLDLRDKFSGGQRESFLKRMQDDQKRFEKFKDAAVRGAESPAVAASIMTRFLTRNAVANPNAGPDEIRRHQQRYAIMETPEGIVQAFTGKALEDPQEALRMAGFVEQELKAFEERSRPLKGTMLVRFQQREALFNAAAEREKRSKMEWSTN